MFILLIKRLLNKNKVALELLFRMKNSYNIEKNEARNEREELLVHFKEVYYETNHLGIFFGMDGSGVLLHPI